MEKNKLDFHEVETIENGKIFISKVDNVTGDVISKTEAMKRKRIYFKPGEFYMVNKRFDDFLLEKYDEYNKLEFGVITWLLRHIGFNNKVEFFRQTDLAKALKTHQSHISRALKKLEEDKVIVKDGHQYVLSESYILYVNDGKGRTFKEIQNEKKLQEMEKEIKSNLSSGSSMPMSDGQPG